MENDIAQIEKYLAGELNNAELLAFEKRLQEDPSFAETFALYRNIQYEMNTEVDEKLLKENLSPLSNKYFTDKTETRVIPLRSGNKRWWMYASAAAAFIVILFLFKPWKDTRLTNEEIYAQYAIPEELPFVARGTNEDSLLKKASELFNKKDYAAAIPLLDSITKLRPAEAQLQLSLGISYLNTGKFGLAINRFDSLAAGQSIYKYDALVWKALSFLKQDNKADCIAVLKQIPANANNFNKAEKMIRQLSK